MRLNDLSDKNWHELVAYLGSHQLPLLLMDDDRCIQASRDVKKYGPECAAAIICAHLYIDANRAVNAAWWALRVYQRMRPDNEHIAEMHNWIVWAGVPSDRGKNWPIQPHFENEREEAGMANVMFHLAAEHFMSGTTSEKLAGIAIRDFLHDGISKKEAERANAGLQD